MRKMMTKYILRIFLNEVIASKVIGYCERYPASPEWYTMMNEWIK